MTRDLFDHPRHLSSDALIRLQDGELPPAAAESARQHLETCWQCRNRAERITATVRSFVNYCDAVVDGLRDAETGSGQGMQALCGRLAQQTRQREGTPRLRHSPFLFQLPWAGLLRPQSLTSLTALLLVGYWFFFAGAGPRAEAAELLSRARLGEEARLRSILPRMTIRQKFEVRHRGEIGHWELWKSPRQNRFEQRWSGPASVAERVRGIYKANGFSPRSPLSVDDFAGWRDRAGAVEERLTLLDGGTGIAIALARQADVGPLEIRAASLTLREPDLHPVSQRLTVMGASGAGEETIELREVAYEVLPEQPATLPRVTPAPQAESPVVNPSLEDLEISEARLREAMHISGLQTRLEPRYRIEKGRVLLQVIVESREQKDQIESLARGIPHVESQAWEPDANWGMRSGEEPAPQIHPLPRTEPALHDFLREYFGTTDLGNQYVGQVQQGLRRSLAATAALQQLADRYPEATLQTLPREAHSAVNRIVRDHLLDLQRAWPQTSELLAPVLSRSMQMRHVAAGTGGDVPAFGAWRESAAGIARMVRQIERNIHLLFVIREGAASVEVDVDGAVAATERLRIVVDKAVAELHLPGGDAS